MDNIRKLQNFDVVDLYDINRVCISPKVMMLLDKVDGPGSQIAEEVSQGKLMTDRHSPVRWPRQPEITTRKGTYEYGRKHWKVCIHHWDECSINQ